MNIEKLSLNDTNCNKAEKTVIVLNGDNTMKNENVTVEYGNENLKQILSDYLKQKYIEILNQEEK